MKTFLHFTLALSLTSSSLFGVCPNALLLRVGDTVKDCDRVGLSVPFEKGVRQDLVQGDYSKKIIEEQAKIITLKDLKYSDQAEQTKLYHDASDKKDEIIQSERNRAKWEFYGGIGLGVLLVLAGALAVKQVSR